MAKRLVGLLLFVASAAAAESSLETRLSEMSRSLASLFADGSHAKVAVTDFSDLNGYQSALGKFVAEELTTQLAMSGGQRLTVVERRHLMNVLAEQKLGATSLFDPESVERIGRILGVQALVTGSITDLGAELKINARVLSVESGRVIGAASASIPNDETTKYLARQVPGMPEGTGQAGVAPVVQPSGAYFENRFLRVAVDRVGVSADRKSLTVSLLMTSLADEDILIGFDGGSDNGCTVMLIDDTGAEAAASAYRDAVAGLACVEGFDSGDQASYTLITGRSSSVMTLRFTRKTHPYSRQEEDLAMRGRTASLSMNLLRLQGSKKARFSVGVTNIALGS